MAKAVRGHRRIGGRKVSLVLMSLHARQATQQTIS
jgi:hypothetical protein